MTAYSVADNNNADDAIVEELWSSSGSGRAGNQRHHTAEFSANGAVVLKDKSGAITEERVVPS